MQNALALRADRGHLVARPGGLRPAGRTGSRWATPTSTATSPGPSSAASPSAAGSARWSDQGPRPAGRTTCCSCRRIEDSGRAPDGTEPTRRRARPARRVVRRPAPQRGRPGRARGRRPQRRALVVERVRRRPRPGRPVLRVQRAPLPPAPRPHRTGGSRGVGAPTSPACSWLRPSPESPLALSLHPRRPRSMPRPPLDLVPGATVRHRIDGGAPGPPGAAGPGAGPPSRHRARARHARAGRTRRRTPARAAGPGRAAALLREQAVSRTLHRYGNVVRPFDEHGAPAGSWSARGHVDVRGRGSARATPTTAGWPRSIATA